MPVQMAIHLLKVQRGFPLPLRSPPDLTNVSFATQIYFINPDGRKEPNANGHPFLRMRGPGESSGIELRVTESPTEKALPTLTGVARGNAKNWDRKTRKGPVVTLLEDRLDAIYFQKQGRDF